MLHSSYTAYRLPQQRPAKVPMASCVGPAPTAGPPRHAERWFDYYSKAFLPWDSHACSTQLAYYLCSPCICQLLARSGSGPSNVPQAHQGHMQPQAAGWTLNCSEDGVYIVQPPRMISHADSTATAHSQAAGAASWRAAHQNIGPAAAAATQRTTSQNSRPNTAAGATTGSATRCSVCEGYRPQPAHGSMLELGCGTGASAVMAAQLGFNVVGVDIVPEAVQAAQATAVQAGLDPDNRTGASGQHAPSATFLQHDIFALPRPFSPAAARRLMSNTAAVQCNANEDLFGFVYDCQSYHVLRQIDEAGYMQLLTSSLAPGGFLLLLAGAVNEPTTPSTPPFTSTAGASNCQPQKSQQGTRGPPQMTEQQLKDAFKASDWEWLCLVKTRFDETEYYRSAFPQPPLAWWGLLRRVAASASTQTC